MNYILIWSMYSINYFPGMVNPRVIKSPEPLLPESFVNRLCRFSFVPALRFFLRSFSSSRTRAVSMAVAGFFIPPLVDVGFVLADSDPLASVAAAAFFLRFFDPGAFLRECERPCSASF